MLKYLKIKTTVNPYVDSTMKHCVPKNQKRSLVCAFDWEEILKQDWDNDSISSMSWKILYLVCGVWYLGGVSHGKKDFGEKGVIGWHHRGLLCRASSLFKSFHDFYTVLFSILLSRYQRHIQKTVKHLR